MFFVSKFIVTYCCADTKFKTAKLWVSLLSQRRELLNLFAMMAPFYRPPAPRRPTCTLKRTCIDVINTSTYTDLTFTDFLGSFRN